MSGKILARMSALSLVMLLAACGGDGDSTPLVDTSGGGSENSGGGTGDSGGDDPNDPTDPDSGQDPDIPSSFRIGYLADKLNPTSFVPNKILADVTTMRADGTNSIKLEVAVIDSSNNNRLVLGDKISVSFFSACGSSGWSSFDLETVNPKTGIAGSFYTPTEKCLGSDIIYARLGDDYSKTAQVTVNNLQADGGTPIPPTVKVGSFDSRGVFQEGIIRANSQALTIGENGTASTKLRLSVLDETGAPDTTNGYNIKFVSLCLDAELATVTTSGRTKVGEFFATYNASGECLVTDKVYAFVGDNNELRASVELVITKNQLAVGSYNPAGAFSKNLTASPATLDYNTDDEPTTTIRSVVAKVDGNGNFISQLTGFESNIEFFSTCLDSNLAKIQSTGTTVAGELISTYTATGCTGEDTIFGRLSGTEELASVSINISEKIEQDLRLGSFDAANTFVDSVIGNSRDGEELVSGSQTRLFVSVFDDNAKEKVVGQLLSVKFSSTCAKIEGVDAPLITTSKAITQGYAELLYTAPSGCGVSGEDEITAVLSNANGDIATANAIISLKAGTVFSLSAGAPTPNSIAPYNLSGTFGERETTSTLIFQLKDAQGGTQGSAVEGKTLTFRLDNPDASGPDVALIEFIDEGLTNSQGIATLAIRAKAPDQSADYDNSVFRIVATYDDGNGNVIETYSAPIAVNSKLPFENRFSLSTSNYAPDARNLDGIDVPLTLRVADDEGNRIRGNTIVNFSTTVGSIDPECVLDGEGRCTVIWESLGIETNYAEITAYTHGRLVDGSTGKIETKVRMLMTTSTGVAVSLNSNTIPADGGEFCAEASVDLDSNGSKYSPPVGTEMKFEVTNGTLLPAASSSYTLGSSSALLKTPYSFTGCTFIEPDTDRTELMKLTVTVTTPITVTKPEGTSDFDRASE